MKVTLRISEDNVDKKLFDYVCAFFESETPDIETPEPLQIGDTIVLHDGYQYITDSKGIKIYRELGWFPIRLIVRERLFEFKDQDSPNLELVPLFFECDIVPTNCL